MLELEILVRPKPEQPDRFLRPCIEIVYSLEVELCIADRKMVTFATALAARDAITLEVRA